jgi:hypothetical protein
LSTNRFDITLAAKVELTERFALAIIAGDVARPDEGWESLPASVERVWRVAEAHANEAIRRRRETNRKNCGAS